jgi:hypothetical protein
MQAATREGLPRPLSPRVACQPRLCNAVLLAILARAAIQFGPDGQRFDALRREQRAAMGYIEDGRVVACLRQRTAC